MALSRGMFAVSVAALQGLAARPVDVAIIGGGPCGLATALALSKSRCLQGIPSVRAHHCMWASGIRTACAYRHGHGHGDMGMGMGMGMGLWAWRWHGMAWHGSALHAHCMCTHACALTHDRCMGTACACFVQAAWRYSRATRSDPRERAFKSPSAAHPNHCSPIGIPGCDRSLCPGCRCISRYGWAALKAIDLDAAHLIRATGEPVTRISLRSLGGGNLTPAPVR